MNLHGLRLFYTVAKLGSVTLAAEKLMISQPAITVQLKKFEKENNIKLFAAKGRGICLTDIGEELFKEAAAIFKIENRLETLIENYKQGKTGTLKIVGNYTLGNFLLPFWVTAFKKANEDVNIEISLMNSDYAIEKIVSYEYDIGILGGDIVNYEDKVDSMTIAEDELWFVVSPEHKYANKSVTLAQIVNEPFIIKKKGSYARNILKSLCYTYGVKSPKIAMEFGELHETLLVLQQGYGVTFCQSMAVREFIELKKLARVYVECKIPKNKIYICVRKNEEKSYLVDKFIKSINI